MAMQQLCYMPAADFPPMYGFAGAGTRLCCTMPPLRPVATVALGLQLLAPQSVAVRPPPGLSLPREDIAAGPPGLAPPPPGLDVGAPPGLAEPPRRQLRKMRSVSDCGESFCSTTDGSAGDVRTPRSETPKAWSSAGSAHDAAEGTYAGTPLSFPPPVPAQADEARFNFSGSSKMVVGTLECPSEGSLCHYAGVCKPCDFVHRGLCTNDVYCKFCHLCGPEENRLRKKMRKATARAVKRRGVMGGNDAHVLDLAEALFSAL